MITVVRERDLKLKCDERACRRPALYIMHVHRVNDCNNPRCDPSGDVSYLLCHKCCAASLQVIIRALSDLDFSAECATCGMTFTSLQDIATCEKLIGSRHGEITTQ